MDPRSERGWTLMEMMIAITLASVILGAATSLLAGVASQHGRVDRQVTAQEKARTAIDTLAARLRNAIGPAGQSTIYSSGATDIVFYTPNGTFNGVTNPRGLRWQRYCLDFTNTADETLWSQTAAYDNTQTGPPSTTTCPSPTWISSSKVATNVVNKASSPGTTLFTPGLDSSGVIRDMQVRLVVKGDALRKPTTITSSIDFRNAKSAPTAVVTCQAQNRHAICDASKSSDPDGEAVGFAWGRVCCSPSYSGTDTRWETGQNSYLYDSGTLSVGTYRVYVKVTDTSGLVSTANTTVVIS